VLSTLRARCSVISWFSGNLGEWTGRARCLRRCEVAVVAWCGVATATVKRRGDMMIDMGPVHFGDQAGRPSALLSKSCRWVGNLPCHHSPHHRPATRLYFFKMTLPRRRLSICTRTGGPSSLASRPLINAPMLVWQTQVSTTTWGVVWFRNTVTDYVTNVPTNQTCSLSFFSYNVKLSVRKKRKIKHLMKNED
jgi:hypothetical protein